MMDGDRYGRNMRRGWERVLPKTCCSFELAASLICCPVAVWLICNLYVEYNANCDPGPSLPVPWWKRWLGNVSS